MTRRPYLMNSTFDSINPHNWTPFKEMPEISPNIEVEIHKPMTIECKRYLFVNILTVLFILSMIYGLYILYTERQKELLIEMQREIDTNERFFSTEYYKPYI